MTNWTNMFRQKVALVMACIMVVATPMTCLAGTEAAEAAAPMNTEIEELQPAEELQATGYDYSEEINGILVRITADEGVFPEGVHAKIVEVKDESVLADIDEAIRDEASEKRAVKKSHTFDITMVNGEGGEEVQPDNKKGSVQVTFALAEKPEDEKLIKVYHVDEVEADKVEYTNDGIPEQLLEDEELSFDLDGTDSKKIKEEITDEASGTSGTVLVAEELDTEVNTENVTDGKAVEVIVEAESFSYYVVQEVSQELLTTSDNYGSNNNQVEFTLRGDNPSSFRVPVEKLNATSVNVTSVKLTSDKTVFSLTADSEQNPIEKRMVVAPEAQLGDSGSLIINENKENVIIPFECVDKGNNIRFTYDSNDLVLAKDKFTNAGEDCVTVHRVTDNLGITAESYTANRIMDNLGIHGSGEYVTDASLSQTGQGFSLSDANSPADRIVRCENFAEGNTAELGVIKNGTAYVIDISCVVSGGEFDYFWSCDGPLQSLISERQSATGFEYEIDAAALENCAMTIDGNLNMYMKVILPSGKTIDTGWYNDMRNSQATYKPEYHQSENEVEYVVSLASNSDGYRRIMNGEAVEGDIRAVTNTQDSFFEHFCICPRDDGGEGGDTDMIEFILDNESQRSFSMPLHMINASSIDVTSVKLTSDKTVFSLTADSEQNPIEKRMVVAPEAQLGDSGSLIINENNENVIIPFECVDNGNNIRFTYDSNDLVLAKDKFTNTGEDCVTVHRITDNLGITSSLLTVNRIMGSLGVDGTGDTVTKASLIQEANYFSLCDAACIGDMVFRCNDFNKEHTARLDVTKNGIAYEINIRCVPAGAKEEITGIYMSTPSRALHVSIDGWDDKLRDSETKKSHGEHAITTEFNAQAGLWDIYIDLTEAEWKKIYERDDISDGLNIRLWLDPPSDEVNDVFLMGTNDYFTENSSKDIQRAKETFLSAPPSGCNPQVTSAPMTDIAATVLTDGSGHVSIAPEQTDNDMFWYVWYQDGNQYEFHSEDPYQDGAKCEAVRYVYHQEITDTITFDAVDPIKFDPGLVLAQDSIYKDKLNSATLSEAIVDKDNRLTYYLSEEKLGADPSLYAGEPILTKVKFEDAKAGSAITIKDVEFGNTIQTTTVEGWQVIEMPIVGDEGGNYFFLDEGYMRLSATYLNAQDEEVYREFSLRAAIISNKCYYETIGWHPIDGGRIGYDEDYLTYDNGGKRETRGFDLYYVGAGEIGHHWNGAPVEVPMNSQGVITDPSDPNALRWYEAIKAAPPAEIAGDIVGYKYQTRDAERYDAPNESFAALTWAQLSGCDIRSYDKTSGDPIRLEMRLYPKAINVNGHTVFTLHTDGNDIDMSSWGFVDWIYENGDPAPTKGESSVGYTPQETSAGSGIYTHHWIDYIFFTPHDNHCELSLSPELHDGPTPFVTGGNEVDVTYYAKADDDSEMEFDYYDIIVMNDGTPVSGPVDFWFDFSEGFDPAMHEIYVKHYDTDRTTEKDDVTISVENGKLKVHALSCSPFLLEWDEDIIMHEVTFNDDEGNFIASSSVAHGSAADAPDAPEKEGHTFKQWDKDFSNIVEDTVVTAVYEKNKYNITWEDDDRSIFRTDIVEYGSMPSDNGITPAKAKDAKYTYAFNGWTPAVEAATQSQVYVATYSATLNKYTVYWNNYDETNIETDSNVPYGTVPTFDQPATPSRASSGGYSYEFAGWDKKVDAIVEDTTYTAVYTAIKADGATASQAAQVTKEQIENSNVPAASGLSSGVDTQQILEDFKGENVKGATNYSSTVAIEQKLTGIEAGGDGEILSLTFEIHPEITITYQDDQNNSISTTQKVENGNIKDAITIRIPTGATTKEYADMTHTHEDSSSETFKVKIKGFGNNKYVEVVITEFSEFAVTFTDGYYEVEGIPAYTYTGRPIEPPVVVKDGGATVSPTEYTVTYSNNINVGTATANIKIKATGDVLSKNFLITAASSSGKSSGGSGGNDGASAATVGITYSKFWTQDALGNWIVEKPNGELVKNAWFCDDYVKGNGLNAWYLIGADGKMLANGLVQDATGNFYSLETNHNGYYGSLRYKDGYYTCNGQMIYLQFEQSHNGSFGAIKNKDGIGKLKAIYGVTTFGINNSNCQYSSKF